MTPHPCCTPPHLLESSSGPAAELAATRSAGVGDDPAELPVAVVGAGPVGLSAAAHLARRELPFVLLEAGPAAGSAVREWGHVWLFSPWKLCVDPVAASMLEEAGWEAPPPDALPTGDDLVERYLEPLASLPAIAPSIRYGHHVTGISRAGRDRLKGASSAERAEAPFLVRYRSGDGAGRLRARAVLDASGTWTRPRPLGADGLPARGETEAGGRIAYGLPDVRGDDRERYAGRRTAVVGAGHSAANLLVALARLGREAPGTEPVWVLRGSRPADAFDATDDDELEARGALEGRLGELVEEGAIEPVADFRVRAVERRGDGVVLLDDGGRPVRADRVVGATGFRPDLEMLRELRLDLDPATEAPRDLGPLIDPNVHSCGTVPPHGEEELRHPEPGFYVVGMKSYGRAPTFLLPTGYEQVRSVVAALAGDREAARAVELELPGAGACSPGAALAAEEEVAGDGPAGAAEAAERSTRATGASSRQAAAGAERVAVDDGRGACCG